MLQLSEITAQRPYYNYQIDHLRQLRLVFISYYDIRQLTLKQKNFITLENPLVALVATFYVLIVFNCFYSPYLLFYFRAFSFFKMFWAYSFDLIFDHLLMSFEMIVYPCQ